MRRYLTEERGSEKPVGAGFPGERFDCSIRRFYRQAARVSLREPGRAWFFVKAAMRQREAAVLRQGWEAEGVRVPPLMIVSVTRQCNLRCSGCFVQAQGRAATEQLSALELRGLFAEARELGVSLIALAGGEPLTRPEIVDIAGGFPEIQFLLITNGCLLDDAMLDKLERLRNIIPIVSLEGFEGETDERRGDGVYARATACMDKMWEREMFFGTSLMITRTSFGRVTSRLFVRELVKRGCRLFFYTDYVPIEPGTEDRAPSLCQRNAESLAMDVLEREFPALFLASSAGEKAFGGCMAAGKGFVHVSAEGDVEPCPFSPFSDVNLRELPLQNALQSQFLRRIRESDEPLGESNGGCALWTKQEWLQAMLAAAPEPAAGREPEGDEPVAHGAAAGREAGGPPARAAAGRGAGGRETPPGEWAA
jgi:MoaA/NifB/PqqE/SkfB family radical SAM enzyme